MCFDVSKNYVALGANSGSVYVFSVKPNKFLKLLLRKVCNSYLKCAVNCRDYYIK